MMKRRAFITLAAGTAAWPFAARGQQHAKLPTIGLLGAATPATWGLFIAAFVRRLLERVAPSRSSIVGRRVATSVSRK